MEEKYKSTMDEVKEKQESDSVSNSEDGKKTSKRKPTKSETVDLSKTMANKEIELLVKDKDDEGVGDKTPAATPQKLDFSQTLSKKSSANSLARIEGEIDIVNEVIKSEMAEDSQPTTKPPSKEQNRHQPSSVIKEEDEKNE